MIIIGYSACLWLSPIIIIIGIIVVFRALSSLLVSSPTQHRLEYMAGQWASAQVPLSTDDKLTTATLFIFLSSSPHPISILQLLHISITEAHCVMCTYVSRHDNSLFPRPTSYFYHGNSTKSKSKSLTWFSLKHFQFISLKCISLNCISEHFRASSSLASVPKAERKNLNSMFGPWQPFNYWHCYMLCFNDRIRGVQARSEREG